MIPYLDLAVYVCLSFVAGFLASSLHLSTWLLQGLHSYLYSDSPGAAHQQQETPNGIGAKGVKGKGVNHSSVYASEGRSKPEETHDMKCDDANSEDRPYVILKKRDRKKKDRFTWEEGSSQIYRLTLSHSHLLGRLYYPEYDEVVVYTVVGLANLLAYQFLSCIPRVQLTAHDHARKFDVIPFLMGLFAVYKIVWLLARVGWQSTTSRVSELILSIVVGCIGFILALCVLFYAPTSALNFGFQSLFVSANASPSYDDLDLRQQIIFFIVARIFVATIAGILAGVLVNPAHKSVRSFWIGTDQLEWNIPLTKWGVLMRFLLHLNVVLPLVASILWVKPMGELSIASDITKQAEGFDAQSKVREVHIWGKLLFPAPSADWAHDFGISRDAFGKVQFWGLLMAGMLQLCLFWVNMQTYLNEAVIVWYESLHRSKVMNLDLIKAKLLLISYFLCRAAVQFFAPGMLLVLLLAMSRVWGGVPHTDMAGASPGLLCLRVAAIFLAWWVTFIWSILTCVTLAFYRTGFLLAS